MQNNKILKTALVLGLLLSGSAFAANSVEDACNSTSKVAALKKQIEDDYCNSGAVNLERPDPEAEEGEPGWIAHFFVNPDECNISIDLPDLFPDFGFDLDQLNSCQLIKAVSSKALAEVDQAFNEIEGQVNGAYEDNGLNDQHDLDLNDVVNDGVNGTGGG